MSSTTLRLWVPARRRAAAAPGWQVRQARRTTRSAGRTFALAARLLGADVRDDVYLLYQVLRSLDDLVDDRQPAAAARVGAVAAWASGGARGVPRTPEVERLAGLDARHPLPREAIMAFCRGMEQDLAEEEFATEADVDRYCFRVAGTVGLLLTAILGSHDPDRAASAAAALGMAMQRTNILRDIDEDAARGRSFISREARRRFGEPQPGHRAALLVDQIARADALYDSGLSGVVLLIRGRRAIAAAAAMYREILREIERDGLGAAPGRAVVPTPRRLRVGAVAALRAG